MKIVFVNYYFYPDQSATSRLLQDLAFCLSSKGIDIRVVTSRRRYDDPRILLPLYEVASYEVAGGVKIYRINTFGFSRRVLWQRLLDAASFYIAVFFKLCFLLERGDRVVSKTDPPLVSFFVMMAAKIKGAVLINWLQDLFPETIQVFSKNEKEGLFTRFLKRARNISLWSAGINVAISEAMKVYLVKQGIEPGKTEVISNWSDGVKIRPVLPNENPLRKEWGLGNKFVIGYSGNMGRVHEFQTLLGAAESLKSEGVFIFLFIGDGPKRKWLENEALRRGISNLLFKPYQPEDHLPESLSVPDVHLVSILPELENFVVPSKFYGIAAAGRPVIYIGSTGGEIARLVRESGCGDVITAGDSRKLEECLVRLYKDPRQADQMGRNARAAFEKKWDKRFGLAAWEKILT